MTRLCLVSFTSPFSFGGSYTSSGKFQRPKHGGSLKGIDPLLQPEKGPAGKLWGPGEVNRTSATLLALVRNEELNDMLSSMGDLERTWNHKFNYPWTFFNDGYGEREGGDDTDNAAALRKDHGARGVKRLDVPGIEDHRRTAGAS